ncbi:hypothetical protein Dcae01_01150 [Deinococcus caeni]|uniref:DUF1028 domain-containing protein n=1 Tax=Deinococcus caeni TaxID=569127 RepID=A0ABP9UF37_9DEIO
MALSVVESSVRSRAGPPEQGADLLLVTPHHVALIAGLSFGATSGGTQPRGLPPARFAATVGLAGLRDLPPEATLREATDHLNAALTLALRHALSGGERPQVGFALAAVSSARREVWQVGPVGALWDDPGLEGAQGGLSAALPSLTAAGQARALVIQALLAQGSGQFTQRQLQASDPAQAVIAPLLVAHASLANSTGPSGYGLINGDPVPDEHLRVHRLPPGPREVSLATAGYPAVMNTLAATERRLQDLLRTDPLLVTRFPYVRPYRPDHEGYADRAYARVRVW